MGILKMKQAGEAVDKAWSHGEDLREAFTSTTAVARFGLDPGRCEGERTICP
jgi:hypothetical protein